jgi:hypothetical protein
VFGQHRSSKLSGQRGWGSQCGENQRKQVRTHREVLLVGEHKLRGAGIICAIGFVDNEFFFLLFRMRVKRQKQKTTTMSNGQWEDQIGHMDRIRTHALQEMLTPSLVRPREFCSALKPDEKFPLEVEKFVQIREEKVDCVLVDDVRLGQRVGIFLPKNEDVNDQAIKICTCMTSRSCTYLRSVSTISRMMLFLADSCALAGGTAVVSPANESSESCDEMAVGEGGAESNASEGRCLTIAVTVLMTWRLGMRPAEER